MIKVSGVRKRFDGVTALDGLDINIEKVLYTGLSERTEPARRRSSSR